MSKPDEEINEQETELTAAETVGDESSETPEGADESEPDSNQTAETVPEGKSEAEAEVETEADSIEISIESLQARLEVATEEVGKFKDVALRAEAEMQNVRRRASRDLENAHKYGTEGFIKNMLPVIDALEKAVESVELSGEDGKNKALIDGVGLCHKMLLDALGRNGVAVVDPLGEPFDPNVHQAMSMVENDDVEPNSVVMVVQKGYTLNDRLIRPAMVMVSKGISPNIDETA